MNTEQRLWEVEETLRLLQIENERLTARAEDGLLLGRLGERIEKAQTPLEVLASLLEDISLLKDVPLCLSLVSSAQGSVVDAAYAFFTEESLEGRHLEPPEDLVPEGQKARLIEGAQLGLLDIGRVLPSGFVAQALLAVEGSSCGAERRVCLFVDNRDAEHLKAIQGVIVRAVAMAVSRLDNLQLLSSLETLSRVLDERVEERTSALREATEVLDGYFSLSLDLFCIAGMDGVFRRMNPAWEQTLGRALSELEGHSFMEFVHPEDRESTLAAVGELAGGQSVFDFRNRLRCKDGTYRWIEWRAAPYQGSLILAAARDVTERMAAEQALRESEQRFRSIVESSPMGIHMYALAPDGSLVFTGANPAADRILGVDNRQFLGLRIEQAFPPLVATEIPERYRRAAADAQTWTTEQVVYSDGRIQGAYEVHAFQTAPGRMAALFLDITERKLAEAEREQLSAELRQAQKMEAVGRLAGGVAHDFNNLLTGILGYCDVVTERLRPEDPIAEDIGEIRAAGERAAALTRQLLAFSRKQIMQPRVVSAASVVTEVQRLMGRILGEDIEVEIHLEPGVGAIRVDSAQLQQVILNLAINARDAMPQGGRLTIETGEMSCDEEYASHLPGMKPGAYVLLIVSDTGCGMDAETLSHVFEPFFTTKEVGRGTGLGLATVHGIVTQSGGFVSVTSAVGKGTTFRIHLPRVDPAEVLSPRPERAPGTSRGSEVILLVEDSPEVRRLVFQALSSRGFAVLEATGPEEALALARNRKGRIDLLLTDVVMPGMSGPVLAQRLTAIHPEIEVLCMSGYTEESIVRHGVVARGLSFIQKPFRPDDLSRRIREILDGGR